MSIKRRKVVHVITTIERGGAEISLLALAREQVKNGYQVVVIPLKGEIELAEEFIQAGVTLDLSLLNHIFISQVIMLRRKYNKNFVFHGHLPRSELLIRMSNITSNFFVTRHNVEPFFPNAPSFLSRFLSLFVTNNRTIVIAISKAVLDFLVESKEVAKETPTSIIYYGFNRRNEHPKVRRLKNTEPKTTLRIGTISRLAPQKNLNLLIDLAELLREKGFRFLIQIVGVGPDESLLKHQIKERGLENEISFLGKTGDVMSFLEVQNVFVLTSKYEGFGLVLLEAMDAELPIIAARNSAIPEILGEGHPGLFISNNLNSLFETMQNILRLPETYEKTMKAQSERLDLFSMERYFLEHHRAYSHTECNSIG